MVPPKVTKAIYRPPAPGETMLAMGIAVYGIAGMMGLTVLFSLLALRGHRGKAKRKLHPPP